MGRLLLVGVNPDEEATLVQAVGAEACLPVPVDGLRSAFSSGTEAVVIGSATPTPLALVQWVHRAQPMCGVLLLTSPETDTELRRSTMYAPDMPASLTVLEARSPALPETAREVLEGSRLRRAHQETIAAVSARESVATRHSLAPASVGALLDHAPFGVLVGDLEGRLVTWNRWAGDLLELSHDVAGRPIPTLFPRSEYLTAAFTLARAGRLEEAAAGVMLEAPGEAVVEVSAAPTRLENGEEAVLVLVIDMSARRAAEETRDRLAEHVELLGRVSESLTGTLDVDMALNQLADCVVPAFADWVSIQTHDERGQSRRIVVRHRDRDLEAESRTIHEQLMRGLGEQSPSRRVVMGGSPVLIEHLTPQQLTEFVPDPATRAVVTRLGVGSTVSVPLPGRDEVRGTMSMIRRPGAPPYTSEDLVVAVEIGRRAGVALDTLSLYAQQRDLAAELQRSMLTEPPENDRAAEVVVKYVAAAEEAQVGGDWYDAFLQPDGGTVLVIGDVMGHDTRAAAAMGQLRSLLRGIGYTTRTGPAEMLSRLDEAIEGLEVHTTATGLVVRVEPRPDHDTGPARLCWSNAGHPPAIVVPPTGGALVLENTEPDLLLGVLAHTERQESSAVLEPGGTLLLYTDGLIERRGQSLDEGVRALTTTIDRLAGLPLPELCDRLLADLLPDENDDDVALVAVRLRTPEETGLVRE